MKNRRRKLAIVPRFVLTSAFVGVVPAGIAAGCSDGGSDAQDAALASDASGDRADAPDVVFQADVSAHFSDVTGDIGNPFDARADVARDAPSDGADGGGGGEGGDASDGASDAPVDGG
jgi:hypothetical protein